MAKISGPSTFNIVNTAFALTIAKTLVAGTYLFELTVTDNGGLSTRDTVEIKLLRDTISNNRPPVANAETDKQIVLPTNTLILDGSASPDPDNNIINYLWSYIAGPLSYTITNPWNAITQVSLLIDGTYVFELKVIDSGNLSSTDTIKIEVLPSNNLCNSSRPMVNAQLTQIGTLS